MKIQDQDSYHGAALIQIVEDPSFKALNKTDAKYGHYTVNTDRRLFVKYLKKRNTPWRFTLQPDETTAIRHDIASGQRTFICLVCGRATICCLSQEELEQVIDLAAEKPQWIAVDIPPGGSQHVSGSAGRLPRTVPHNAFPSKVIA